MNSKVVIFFVLVLGIVVGALSWMGIVPTAAPSPWGYHGVTIGAHMTDAEVMRTLGVKHYADHYDSNDGSNQVYCDSNGCQAPAFENSYGASHIYVDMQNGVVRSITVFFDSVHYDDVRSMAKSQFGADGWMSTGPDYSAGCYVYCGMATSKKDTGRYHVELKNFPANSMQGSLQMKLLDGTL